MDLNKIKDFWNIAGKKFPFNSNITPTSRDPFLGELERDFIISKLNKNFVCLEVGCGDAFHSVHYAKKVKQLTGIDISESLINIADKRLKMKNINNVNLHTGSVLEIEKMFKGQKFDCAISQRCLINLSLWKYQKNAILQIHKLLNKNGILILTEGFQENLDNLNYVRKKLKLKKINVVGYNKNFTLIEFLKFINKYFDVIETYYYGSYLFLSRIFHPLMVYPKEPKHNSKLNKTAMMIQKRLNNSEFNKFSYNIAFVLRKKNKD